MACIYVQYVMKQNIVQHSDAIYKMSPMSREGDNFDKLFNIHKRANYDENEQTWVVFVKLLSYKFKLDVP